VFIRAAGVAGDGVANAYEALEDDLGMPETPFGEVGDGFVRRRFVGFFDGDIDLLGLTAGGQEEEKGEWDDKFLHT
jgi:hypothetical protein